jgi:hypothetical protein
MDGQAVALKREDFAWLMSDAAAARNLMRDHIGGNGSIPD